MVYLLGKPYPLRLQPGPKVEVRQAPSHLLLTLPDPEDPQRRVRAMEAFLKQTCLTVTTQLCRQYQPQLAPFGVPMPEIRVRSMTSRWGSCSPPKGG